MAPREKGSNFGSKTGEVPSPMAGGSAAAQRQEKNDSSNARMDEKDLFSDFGLDAIHARDARSQARAQGGHRGASGGLAEVVDIRRGQAGQKQPEKQPEKRSEQVAGIENNINGAIARLVGLFKEGGGRDLILPQQIQKKDPAVYREDARRLASLIDRTKDELAKMGEVGRLLGRLTGRTTDLEKQATAWRKEYLQAVRQAKIAERLRVLDEIEEGLTQFFHLVKSLPQVQEKFPFAELYSRGPKKNGSETTRLRVRVGDIEGLLTDRGFSVGPHDAEALPLSDGAGEEDGTQNVA